MLLYDDFVKVITNIDSRNIIEKCSVQNIAEGFPGIYMFYDLVNVEVPCSMGDIRFVPRKEFDNVKLEYPDIEAECIFATNNGEPLFMKDGKVFTCLFGKGKIFYEEIAESFDAFLEIILND